MRYIILISLLFIGFPLRAAEIARDVGQDRPDIISVTGVLNVGDDAVFRKLAASSDKAIVVLNSEGGSVLVGIEIGRAIRLRGFATAVSAQTLCASACALTWLAGSPRFLDRTSKVGFHAAYRVIDGKASESGVGNALVGAYLNQIGLPDNAIIYVTSAPPEGIEWLTAVNAPKVGISYEPFLSQAASSGTNPSTVVTHDPLATVTAFYSALAAADGESASALVVPEKRGKGPFNENSIHMFFGSMSKPLRLTGTVLRDNDDVRVSYEYETNQGKRCHGHADVQTVYTYGKTLISRIKALDGC
ncbi:hypothetical protein [Rhizobium rhizogenes]|uniref:COG3904 family protein n=1 Tax=Rhizobium rhizogenes TaxID=359 RepID=UPI00080FDC97|nr:hypothetical protein [Rhizobium rhizogenes]NTI41426.1 hypothetical protein [Rhizobium rhizogenes]OCJ26425.1 hypothetical protein A6U88_03685 [Agrobacterium sp. B131/95]